MGQGEVIVIATFRVKPGNEDEVERILTGLIEPSQSDEGCIRYALHRSQDDPSVYAMIERWSSREALDAHLRQPHVQVVAEAVGLLAEPPQIHFTEAVPIGDEEKGRL